MLSRSLLNAAKRLKMSFLFLREAFYVCAHLGHTLLAVFRGGNAQLLNKSAIKGTRSVKADERADLRNAERGIEQIAASL